MVLYVGGRVLWVKFLKCNFLVSLAPLGLERCGNVDFTTPKAQKVGKIALSNWLICPFYSVNLNIAQSKRQSASSTWSSCFQGRVELVNHSEF